MRALASFLGIVLLVVVSAVAQTPVSPPPADGDAASSLVSISALLDSMARKREVISGLDGELASAPEPQKMALLAARGEAARELDRLQRTLESIAAGVDLGVFDAPSSRFDLVSEVTELLRPLIEELKEVTAEPRLLEQLRGERAQVAHRLDSTQRGLVRIRRLREAATDDAVRSALGAAEQRWTRQASDLRNAMTVLQHRLDEKQRERKSVYESARDFFGGFFRERGLNLILAVLAFTGVLFGLRLIYVPVMARITNGRQRRFWLRLAMVLGHVLMVVAALGAALGVLYAAGDWILLGLALLFLLGLAWAGKQTLPRMWSQIRLMLNLGSIREGERVVLEGLPWRVERLGLSARLVNPELSGGMLDLPLSRFFEVYSRPCGDAEPWFPSRVGDYVVVGDVRGRVAMQTPDLVELIGLGGTRISLRARDYLAARPANLSAGFCVRSPFALALRHQAHAATTIPQVMTAAIDGALRSLLGASLASVRVELQSTVEASLGYLVLAEVGGQAAAQHEAIGRVIQRAVVDVCNAQGWQIAVPRLDLQQAG